jgi:CRISPR-associated protein Cmr4
MTTWRYVLHALTPLHVGTGEGAGLIDQPIQRDPATGHPLVPGSSAKGVLRDAARGRDVDVTAVFGPDTRSAHLHAGALQVSDARILLFPVRSDSGTFAWVTCPWVLARLLRELGPASFAVPRPGLPKGTALREGRSPLVLGGRTLAVEGVLDDVVVVTLTRWVFPDDPWWATALRERLVVVSDAEFTFFVEHATDVRAHIRIEADTGTVADGGLWYEESLPAETILAGFLQAAPNGKATREVVARAVEGFSGGRLQVGANASTGMGVCRFLAHRVSG